MRNLYIIGVIIFALGTVFYTLDGSPATKFSDMEWNDYVANMLFLMGILLIPGRALYTKINNRKNK